MSRGLQKLVWIVLLAGLLLVQGSFYDNMNDMDEKEYTSDDEFLEDRINLADDEEENSESQFRSRGSVPKILSPPRNLTVIEGTTVFFPCEVENGDLFTILWKNGTKETLYADYSKLKVDPRVWKFPNNTLGIVLTNIYDSGSYYCQVIAPDIVQVVHHLLVYRNLSLLYMTPQVQNNESFTMSKGEPLTLTCNVTGYPPPQILWTRSGDHLHFPNGHQIMEGETLHFKRVNRFFTGTYKCTAKNVVQSVEGSVKVVVQHMPEIDIEQDTMTSKVGLSPHLVCIVYAEPSATVKWYKNNLLIDDENVYTFSQKNHRFILQVNKMTERDFGNYKCVATNSFGSDEKIIILSGAPTKPIFKGGPTTDKNVEEIKWFTESYSPIIEYEFQYRHVKGGGWKVLTPVIIQSVQNNIYTAKVILLGLPAGDYKIRVRARNALGWSLFSEEKEFKGDIPSRGGPPVIKPIVTVLPFIVAVCVCYM